MLVSATLRPARMELVFFTAACMMLCFGCVPEAVLITDPCCNYCWALLTRCQGLLFRMLPAQQAGWGCVWGWGRTQLRELTQTVPKRDPRSHNITLSKKTGGAVGGWVQYSRGCCCFRTGWALVSKLVVSNGFCIALFCFVLFVSPPFSLLSYLHLSPGVLALVFFQFCPLAQQGQWASSCVLPNCLPGLIHNICWSTCTPHFSLPEQNCI